VNYAGKGRLLISITTFGDVARGQRFLFDLAGPDWYTKPAAEEVYKKFAGKTVSLEEIKEFVLVETPYLFRKSILNKLEEEGRIIRVVRRNNKPRRRGTFPDGCIISFRGEGNEMSLV